MISSFKKIEGVFNIGKGGIICTSKELKNLTLTHQIIPVSAMIS